MHIPQPQPEERRLAQQACKIDERRLQPHAYEMPYDQETETAREAQLSMKIGV